jgi:hypothetical protein
MPCVYNKEAKAYSYYLYFLIKTSKPVNHFYHLILRCAITIAVPLAHVTHAQEKPNVGNQHYLKHTTQGLGQLSIFHFPHPCATTNP